MSFLRKIRQTIDHLRGRIALELRCVVLRIKCFFHPTAYRTYDRNKPKHAPIFIVGCGHSGTSFLLAVLAAHSKICAIPGETRLAYNYITNEAVLDHAAPLMIRSFDLLTISQNKARWIEKTPKHIFSIPLLRRTFPQAKFIIILRDGRDVACSIEARYGSLAEGIRRWIEDNRVGQPFWNDADVHVLKYEDLIENFADTITKALSFLGEEFEEQVLRSHETPKYFYSKKIEKPPDESQVHHDQYRNWQINQKLFDGRGKWKQLSEEKKTLIKKAAGEMLIEYGYTTNLNW